MGARLSARKQVYACEPDPTDLPAEADGAVVCSEWAYRRRDEELVELARTASHGVVVRSEADRRRDADLAELAAFESELEQETQCKGRRRTRSKEARGRPRWRPAEAEPRLSHLPVPFALKTSTGSRPPTYTRRPSPRP